MAPKFLPVYILLYCRELNARFIDCLRGWILSAKCQLNKGFPWAQKNIRLPLCYRYEAVGNSIENSCWEAKFQARVSSLPRSLNFYILGSPGQACWFNKGSQTWFQERLWRKIDARGRDQRRQTSYARLRGYMHFRIFLTS